MPTSVVIPTRNNAGTIRACLESLIPYLDQGYIEDIIVVDAHSNDGTRQIISEYPVTVLEDEGKGVAIAYDLGWRASRGGIVMFLDGDAYLDKGYFPALLVFFEDPLVGVLGCGNRAVVTNLLSRTVGEQWSWFKPGMNNSSIFKRLYGWLVFCEKDYAPGGPCLVARRQALEEVGGFTWSDLPCGADMQLSRKIMNAGFGSVCWPDAPLFHHPRSTLKELIKEYSGLAREDIQRERMENLSNKGYWRTRLVKVGSRLASPAIAVILALRFRNPYHLIVYPAIRYAWAWAYLSAWLKRPDRGNRG